MSVTAPAPTVPLPPSDPDHKPMAEATDDMPLPTDPKTIFLGGLFVLACFTVMHAAREVILPVVLALVLKLLLQPLVRFGERLRVPRALGALVSIMLLLGVFASLGTILSGPAADWMRNAPAEWERLQTQYAWVKEPVQHLRSVMGRAGIEPSGGPSINPEAIASTVASSASSVASHLLETLLILFYMLVFGETFMRRLVEVLPSFKDKKEAVGISSAIEHDISVYLLTVTVINAMVGGAVAGMSWAFGLPGWQLWGVVAFCLNYVPILGPLAGVGLFVLIGLAALGASWFSLLPAAAYLGIHVMEGEIVTPMILARRFTINPIAVIVGLIFWYWMWGVQGAILAVPLLAIAKIMCDRLRPLRAFGHLLEG